MSTTSIDEIEITLPEADSPRKLAMRYENKTVHLYLLNASNAVRPDGPKSLLDLITAIRDTYYEGHPLSQFNWHLRAGHATSTVSFYDRQNASLQMNVSNELVCHAEPGTIEDYRRDRFKEFNPVLELKIDPPEKPESYFTQKAPDGKTYFLQHGSNSSAETSEVVYVDTKKFLQLLKRYSPEQAFSEKELQFRKREGLLGDWTGSPQSLLKVSSFQAGNNLIFGISAGSSDLLASLQASGVDKFPVAVDKEQARLLKSLCGAAETGTNSRPVPAIPYKR